MVISAVTGPPRHTGAYRLERVQLEKFTPDLLSRWQSFLNDCPPPSFVHDPHWLSDYFGDGKESVAVYFLYEDDLLRGVAPIVTRNWPLRCQLGEVTLATVPMRRVRLLGTPHFPADADAYKLLFQDLGRHPHDAVYLQDIPVESFLWKFVAGDDRTGYRRYVPDPPRPRVLLRLNGDWESYMQTFSPKHRQTLRRKVRRFQDTAPGQIRFERITTADQVSDFIDRAVAISRRTYQWNLLGQGLRQPDDLKRQFALLAERNLLRSYLLSSGETPCAFLTGFQHKTTFWLDDMGYDPAWRQHSVGTVLQMEVIQDLFAWNQPAIYDLGEYGPHKEEFGNETYLQTSAFLFRPTLYNGIARFCHRFCHDAGGRISAALNRAGVKEKLKKRIRSWSAGPDRS